MQKLKQTDKEIYDALEAEKKRQEETLNLIPSENYPSRAVMEATGGVFMGKYAEGYPGRRYYGGNTNADVVENLARERAKALFRADHANVQPLSGTHMNMAVYLGLLKPGDGILAMDLSHGGHLSHGSPVSHTGKLFDFQWYKVNKTTGKIDFENLRSLALQYKPKLIVCGYTSYPRDYDYADFKKVADEIGAITMADISHIGGLVAGGVMANPFDVGFDIVTATTHKTLRGPRGGIILCKKEFAEAIDKSVFPGLQGGPHMDNIAGIAVALLEANTTEFKTYAKQVLTNAQALSTTLSTLGAKLVTGSTENHLLVVDTVASFGLDGKETETILESVGIIVNKQIIPDDSRSPMKPSGIRLGTPAITTRGMGEKEMETVAELIFELLLRKNEAITEKTKKEVKNLCSKFPINP